jgi:hypothetical protein
MKHVCRYLVRNVAALLLLSSVIAHAQTVTTNNDLQFGSIFPGIPKTINKTDVGSAAEFHITGTEGAEVSIDIALPTYMSTGGPNMQLIFFETGAALDTSATPDQSNPPVNNLNPWHTITYRLGANGLTLWLGGKVVPGLVQAAGDYSATIVVTVAYTGL